MSLKYIMFIKIYQRETLETSNLDPRQTHLALDLTQAVLMGYLDLI